MQIAARRRKHNPAYRPINSIIGSELEAIRRQTEAWVRTQISGNLRHPGRVDIRPGRDQGGVYGLELVFNLLPGKGVWRILACCSQRQKAQRYRR